MFSTILNAAIYVYVSTMLVPQPPGLQHKANPDGGFGGHQGGMGGPHGGQPGSRACCLPDGSCDRLPLLECLAQGGTPRPTPHCENADCLGFDLGACCVGNMGGVRACLDVPAQVCASLNGEFQGQGTSCPNDPMDPGLCVAPTFACCFGDNGCSDLSLHDCITQGGQPHPGQSCEQADCHGMGIGACCVSNGGVNGCIEVPSVVCQMLMGDYQGNNTSCQGDPTHPPPCGGPNIHACCLPSGECTETTPQDCLEAGGQPRPAPTCAQTDCHGMGVGACCVSNGGANGCIVVPSVVCQSLMGDYQGNNTTCEGDPTHPPPCGGQNTHACCLPSGECVVTTPQACFEGGGHPRPANSCEGIDCTPPSIGACCIPNMGPFAGCILVPQNHCEQIGGDYQGDGSMCHNNPSDPPVCPEPSFACCLDDGSCITVSFMACMEAGGQPRPFVGCDEAGCGDVPILGACCIANGMIDGCIETRAGICAELGGDYQGDGTRCAGGPNEPPPCGEITVACCLPDGTCVMTGFFGCVQQGGQPNPAASCELIDCQGGGEVGACCLGMPFACIIAPQMHCVAIGGTYQGDGTTCQGFPGTPPPCGDPVVPCCLPAPIPEGVCEELPFTQCLNQGGVPFPAPSCENVQCGGPARGACCTSFLGGVHCVITTEAECNMQFQGVYQGDGTSCGDPMNPNPCGEPTVACCLADGTCAEISFHDCLALGGSPNPGVSCLVIECPNVPQVGACCVQLPGAPGCIVVSAAECMQLMGSYQGDGTSCQGNPMDPPPCGDPIVACCLPAPIPEGVCEELPRSECLNQGGQPFPVPSCEFVTCGGQLQGACCTSLPGIPGCLITTEAECVMQFLGTYQGDGTDCIGDPMNPNPCNDPTLACCLPDGSCAELSLLACFGAMGIPQNTPSCANVDCGGGDPTGACCFGALGGCAELTQASCIGQMGSYQGDGTSCEGNPMDPTPCGAPPTACCLANGTCNVIAREQCLAKGGQPQPSLQCTNTTCNNGGGIGACCLSQGPFLFCLMVDEMHCLAIGGSYQGAGSHCPNNPAEPCGP